jgi:hypothetical protein
MFVRRLLQRCGAVCTAADMGYGYVYWKKYVWISLRQDKNVEELRVLQLYVRFC